MPALFEPRFGQVAGAFSAYRPPYPQEIFERILARVAPDRRRRAMDLGAGTGRATHELAAHFEELIAVEPDPLMAEKLRALEPRALLRITTAEECVQEPASVDLVIVANAIHWMDGPIVMKNVVSWLRPEGILAVIDAPFPGLPRPLCAVFRREFEEHWNAFRDPRLGKAGNLKDRPWQKLVDATAGLKLIDEKLIESVLPMSPADFVGLSRSTSYGSAYARSLADPESYWRDLESRLHLAWREEKFPVDFSPTLLLAKRV